MRAAVKKLIVSDLLRYDIVNRKQAIYGWFRYPGVRYFVSWRIASNSSSRSLSGLFFRFLCRHYSHKFGYQISIYTRIDEGLYIGHWGTIVINSEAKIGKHCNIAQGVTIGQTNRGKNRGAPVIGDRVWIGANAVVVGKIRVGNNVLIAPNSFVNMDIPDNSVVTGNPARITYREDATKGYIGD